MDLQALRGMEDGCFLQVPAAVDGSAPEAVGAEAPPTVAPADHSLAPVGAASAATNAARCFPASESVQTDASLALQCASNPRSAPAAAKATAILPNAVATPHRLGRLAVASLHAELACAPKPGLVTPFDRGSHDDMDASAFLRSLFALRGYFVAIAAAGMADAPFATLRQRGIEAERAMLRATGGVNTHRGAIFSLGLLVAAAARLRSQQHAMPDGVAVCNAVGHWHDALLDAPLDPHSHGQRMRRRHGVAGVREQAAEGFPLLREVALPTLRRALRAGVAHDAAMAQTLLQLIAQTDDLNLLQRGGHDGLRFAQCSARAFLEAGGVAQPDWRQQLAHLGEAFVARRLSPGGSADLLACACFLQRQEAA